MNNIDMFSPQIKLGQDTINQKSINESVSYDSDNSEDQTPLDGKGFKDKKKSQASKLFQKSIYQHSQAKRKKIIKKFCFIEQSIKKMALKLINKSYILQKKFSNHHLLSEEYLNGYSLKFRNIDKSQKLVPIISFNNKAMQLWEIVKQVIYLYFMWIMPFSNSFLPNQDIQISELILFLFLIVDNILQLNQEIIVNGQSISDRLLILKHYVKNKLLFELIYMILQQQISQLFNIVFFFLNLKKFQQFIQNQQERAIIVNEKINLLELFITVILLTHFMACLWFYVGTMSQSYYAESWILKIGLQNETVLTQYCYSFYWAATTMVTVGYGDITGQNLYEITCSTILLFFSSGIFAFSMNSIGMILNNINQNGLQYRRNLLLINQYMTSNDVSSDLQVKVRNYLQFYYQSSSSNDQKDVHTIIDELSQNLKFELVNDVREKVIEKNKFLSMHFSRDTRFQTVLRSQSINFTPLEQIYQQQSNKDHSMYIILKGIINLNDRNSGRIIQQLKQGDSFGELEFLTEQPRHFSAYSKGFSQILKMNRSDFINIIKQNQQDFEKFHMLKDQAQFNLEPISQCIVCQENHNLLQCNKIFYKPEIEKVIKQDLFHTYQKRQKYHRLRQKNLYQLLDYQIIKESCIQYRYDYEKDSGKSIYNISQVNLNLSESELNTQSIQKSKFYKKDIDQNQQLINRLKSNNRFEQDDEKIQLQDQNNNKISSILINSNEKIITQSKQKVRIKNNNLRESLYNTQTKQLTYFDPLNFETQYFYKNYFPKNNARTVLRSLNLFNKTNVMVKTESAPSKYRFFQLKRFIQQFKE